MPLLVHTSTQRDEYSSTAERLLTLASAMPGFISFRHYTSDDGEMLAVVEFASAEALASWRDHPDHRKAQQRGSNDFYAEYEIIYSSVIYKSETHLTAISPIQEIEFNFSSNRDLEDRS